ncbi:MAG TPA: CPBP family intramembrane glutamic endopeptidase [Opitutaceae bacterium]
MPEVIPETLTPAIVAVGMLQLLLLLAGCVLLWRLVLRPEARRHPRPAPALGAWQLPIPEFLLVAFTVLAAGAGAQGALGLLGGALRQREIWIDGDLWIMLNGVAFQLGMLLGALAGWFFTRPRSTVATAGAPSRRPVLAGVVTFVAMMPVLTAVNVAWTLLLDAAGLPIDRQNAIGLFTNADSPLELIVVTLLAVVIAPVVEELIFRAGLFRYLRTRTPRWIALVVPAVVFAALHVDWMTFSGLVAVAPLAALAVIFSLVYERTGRIAVTMIAHGLFNLNTILLLLAGVSA